MAKQPSRGICQLCGTELTKAGISKHLKTCVLQHDAKGKSAECFHLRVTAAGAPMYWLDLEIKASASLEDLDGFLRDVWLECCGHLSSFEIDGQDYHIITEGLGGKSMKVRIKAVLDVGQTFSHIYDYGSSTYLDLKVVAVRQGNIGRDGMRLLAKNKAPEWPCAVCGQAADVIDTEAMWSGDQPFYCEQHSDEDEDYWYLPVVNSPRMGICGYEG